MRRRMIFIGPLAILGVALFIFLGGEAVLHLWNWLAPPLFGFRQLTFWQALGLLALCRILFGGLGCHRSGGSRSRTPEERERIRQFMRGRWGSGPSTSQTNQV